VTSLSRKLKMSIIFKVSFIEGFSLTPGSALVNTGESAKTVFNFKLGRFAIEQKFYLTDERPHLKLKTLAGSCRLISSFFRLKLVHGFKRYP
jgi:hypothetical protein